jgi:hypothetical protein
LPNNDSSERTDVSVNLLPVEDAIAAELHKKPDTPSSGRVSMLANTPEREAQEFGTSAMASTTWHDVLVIAFVSGMSVIGELQTAAYTGSDA